MKRTLATIAFAASLFAGALPSCGGAGDVYSQVAAVCNYTDPGLANPQIIIDPNQRLKTTLTPECKAALEAVIPYDEASFATAPTGFKDHVTEAFQILVGYPLHMPDNNKLLGVSPDLAGAIPLEQIRIFQESGNNLNQAIFNYVLGQVDQIEYDGSPQPDGRVARWMPAASDKPRRMTFYKSFWSVDDVTAIIPTPFLSTATLVHEARHGDGITHVLCEDSSMGLNCDNDLQGAYGMEVAYLHLLLNGSAVRPAPDRDPPLGRASIMLIGDSMCNILKPGTQSSRINHPFPALADELANVKCDTEVTYAWIMEHEGLPALPPPPGN